jgi:glycine cleavage system regulatory protein
MQASLVLTLIGADRPGLVETVARVVADHGGNWVESRMARLAGKFAGVLRIDLPRERLGALRDALAQLKAQGLTVIAEDALADGDAQGKTFLLELIGHDRPGIVRDVARAIAQRHVNVISLETEMFSAAMSGEQMFRAVAHLQAPAGIDIEELRESLEAIASELQVDLTLGEGAAAAGRD